MVKDGIAIDQKVRCEFDVQKGTFEFDEIIIGGWKLLQNVLD